MYFLNVYSIKYHSSGLSASLDSDYSFVKSGTSEVDITVNGEDVR